MYYDNLTSKINPFTEVIFLSKTFKSFGVLLANLANTAPPKVLIAL